MPTPLRLRELEQHEQDNAALRRQQAELLAAVTALEAEMRQDALSCRGAEKKWVSQYWADKLAAILKDHEAPQ
jgi:hypothetical protein